MQSRKVATYTCIVIETNGCYRYAPDLERDCQPFHSCSQGQMKSSYIEPLFQSLVHYTMGRHTESGPI